jgi:hypothetical protein
MKLATVKLKNKRTGEVKIINQTEYARDIARWHEWKALTWQRGDATDELEVWMEKQAIKEIARVANPNHEARKDPQRAYEARQGRGAPQPAPKKVIIP